MTRVTRLRSVCALRIVASVQERLHDAGKAVDRATPPEILDHVYFEHIKRRYPFRHPFRRQSPPCQTSASRHLADVSFSTNGRFAPETAVACSGRDTTQRSRLKFIDHSPRRSQPGRLPRVFAEGASEECGRVRRRRVAAARSKCLRAPGPQAPNARETSE